MGDTSGVEVGGHGNGAMIPIQEVSWDQDL